MTQQLALALMLALADASHLGTAGAAGCGGAGACAGCCLGSAFQWCCLVLLLIHSQHCPFDAYSHRCMLHAGAWKHTDVRSCQSLRQTACKVNNPAKEQWNAQPPEAKDHQYFKKAAQEGDEQIAAGIGPDSDAHGRKQNGVKASHVFHKLAYWQESIRGPDPMHTMGGCIKSVFTMVAGAAYTNDILRELALYESTNNGR